MTCIVGYIDKEKIYMGCDSAGTSWCTQRELAKPKVMIKNSDNINFIIGVCGSIRLLNIIEYRFVIPEFRYEKSNIDTYINTTFIDSLKQCLLANGNCQSTDSVQSMPDGSFLVGINGRLFEIQSNFAVVENNEKNSVVGSGREYAYGSLHTTKNIKSMSVESRVTKAIESAITYDIYCGGEIKIESIG